MEPERKQKIHNKKNLDKKYKKSFLDEDKAIRQRQKIYKQKKQRLIEEDYSEDMNDYS
jgi:hypothetical protein